jgi:hypothetical protein
VPDLHVDLGDQVFSEQVSQHTAQRLGVPGGDGVQAAPQRAMLKTCGSALGLDAKGVPSRVID